MQVSAFFRRRTGLCARATAFAAILGFTAAWAVPSGAQTAAPSESQPTVKAGQALAEDLCSRCHHVGPALKESPVPEAPAFATIARVHGAEKNKLLDFEEAMEKAIAAGHPDSPMPVFGLTDEERSQLIAYMLELRKLEAKKTHRHEGDVPDY